MCSDIYGLIYARAAERMTWRSNTLRLALRGLWLGLQNRAGHTSQRRTRETMCDFAAVCLARIRGSNPWLESVCVSSRWKVLSGEFRRRPTALATKFRKLDRVGRRGLFEPREDFSRLITYAILWLCPRLCPWLDSVARFRRSIPWLYSRRAVRAPIIAERNQPRRQNISRNPPMVNPIKPSASPYPYFQCSSGIKSKFIP